MSVENTPVAKPTSDDVFLLYLDILGFKDLAKRRSMDDIERLFQNMVIPIASFKSKGEEPRALSFSDTVVIWEDPRESSPLDALLALCGLAGEIWVQFVGAGVPLRGIITFGPFRALVGREMQAQVFFGGALISAYLQESADNWIGIRVDSSAFQQCKESLRLGKRDWLGCVRDSAGEQSLLLNPLFEIFGLLHPDLAPKKSNFLLRPHKVEEELKALAFLLRKAHEFRTQFDITGRIAQKYFATQVFLADALGMRGFERVATLAGKSRFPLDEAGWESIRRIAEDASAGKFRTDKASRVKGAPEAGS